MAGPNCGRCLWERGFFFVYIDCFLNVDVAAAEEAIADCGDVDVVND